MFLKYETTSNEFFAVNPEQVAAIRDFGNDVTEIILTSTNTKFYAKKSYIDVLGELNVTQN